MEFGWKNRDTDQLLAAVRTSYKLTVEEVACCCLIEASSLRSDEVMAELGDLTKAEVDHRVHSFLYWSGRHALEYPDEEAIITYRPALGDEPDDHVLPGWDDLLEAAVHRIADLYDLTEED